MMRGGIVLAGPPGSGKTAVGSALAELGYWFDDREAALLARYGPIAEFRARKDEAVDRLHADFLAALQAETRPWVYESTALTERDWVALLRDEFGGFLVRLDVSLETALQRVADRAAGGNLSNEASMTELMWRACTRAYETMAFDLAVETNGMSASQVSATIDAAFQAAAAIDAR
jgi:shikimate kinase